MHNRLIMYPHENSLFPRSGSCGTELVSIFEWVIFISSVAIQSGFSKHSVCRFTAVPWITSLYLNFHDFWNFFFASCVYQNPHWLESVIAPHAEPYESRCHIQNTHPWFHQISNSEYFCFSWQWHMIMIMINLEISLFPELIQDPLPDTETSSLNLSPQTLPSREAGKNFSKHFG